MSPTTPAPKNQSTGPRTPEGKARSAMNALRHGLTGRVVVMPHEDLNAYRSFCAELMKDLTPEGPLETQFAQTVCDTQWRLNRIRAIEDSLFALGHFAPAGHINPGHPEIHAALTAARVFRDQSKTFANLSLYEQRLNRALKDTLRQLRELQAKRRAEAAASQNSKKTKAEPPAQFVFSARQTESEPRPRNQRRAVGDPELSLKIPLAKAA